MSPADCGIITDFTLKFIHISMNYLDMFVKGWFLGKFRWTISMLTFERLQFEMDSVVMSDQITQALGRKFTLITMEFFYCCPFFYVFSIQSSRDSLIKTCLLATVGVVKMDATPPTFKKIEIAFVKNYVRELFTEEWNVIHFQRNNCKIYNATFSLRYFQTSLSNFVPDHHHNAKISVDSFARKKERLMPSFPPFFMLPIEMNNAFKLLKMIGRRVKCS